MGPMNFCGLEELEMLALDDNKLTSLPPYFGNLRSLRVLGLSGNFFDGFPLAVCALTSLERFYIGQHQGKHISKLPDQIRFMQNLRELYIENNHLASLPSSIRNLTQLQVLDCSNNRLTSLPKTLFELKGLKKLRLSFNDLNVLDSRIDELGKLEELRWRGIT